VATTVTTTVWVVCGIHNDTANGWSDTQAAFAAG
jgi:hypothetical protein